MFYKVVKQSGPLDILTEVDLGNGVTMEFAKIPAGTFIMGWLDDGILRAPAEQPLTEVTISHDFHLGKFEVTQAQWQAVMGSNPSKFQGDDLPVDRITWGDAHAFCLKLTEQEQNAGRLPEGYAYTLPTEAQWEYACRAGTTTRFYYGDDPDFEQLEQYAWYAGNSDSKTHAVGEKLPNQWGLYDMHGNVWEWCSDYFVDYPGGSLTDPEGEDEIGVFRSLRGCSWGEPGTHIRSSTRIGWFTNRPSANFGFRVAISSVPVE